MKHKLDKRVHYVKFLQSNKDFKMKPLVASNGLPKFIYKVLKEIPHTVVKCELIELNPKKPSQGSYSGIEEFVCCSHINNRYKRNYLFSSLESANICSFNKTHTGIYRHRGLILDQIKIMDIKKYPEYQKHSDQSFEDGIPNSIWFVNHTYLYSPFIESYKRLKKEEAQHKNLICYKYFNTLLKINKEAIKEEFFTSYREASLKLLLLLQDNLIDLKNNMRGLQRDFGFPNEYNVYKVGLTLSVVLMNHLGDMYFDSNDNCVFKSKDIIDLKRKIV